MNQDLYIKIAFWYYTLHMTQDEIAKRLGFTRQRVNQIINSLVDQGIVSIHVHGYEGENVETESQLEQLFSLNQVIIASDYGDPAVALYKVANVAAQYLDKTIQQGDIIGVSWGQTLAEVIKNMEYQKKGNCRVVQLLGAQNIDYNAVKSDEIVRAMADKLDCPSCRFYAPVVVSYAETKHMLLQEKTIQQSFEWISRCNIGVLGIGELTESSTMCKIGYYSPADIKKLRADGFRADIAMNPVRLDGTTDHCFMEDRLINPSMDTIRHMKNAIGIACGTDKTEAILAVLRSGCLNTLIIDETTAKAVLKRARAK